MKTYQLLLVIAFIIGSIVGIVGQFEFYVPFLTESVNLWIHLSLCAFCGLFGLILLIDFVVSTNLKISSLQVESDMLGRRIKENETILNKRISDYMASTKELAEFSDRLTFDNNDLKAENESLKNELETLNYFSEKMKELKAENAQYRKRFLSSQGNLAQMTNRYRLLKDAQKHIAG